ncbi:uncharacterized protein MYCFIDRAFT_80287 [Pseudocercospora fijiensis CIRAD86]|uniref:Peptidase A1 domain-containing protein n=1 Tax=Pseudocercospora fijiensis (strain CIRAD86) TaxID=383855 RepID=M2YYD6_PSEFD|nr:uncharacterized protein MYCFIDRAFT_80287 [Pseudocercospora fijiensis CIRAD86]EME82655.1 hypothetical protein MYCFIDRAFT_80287 [Pseudocercospora fijiensis CIRAD86]
MAPSGHHHLHFGKKEEPVVRAAIPAHANAPLQGLSKVKCIRNPKYAPTPVGALMHLCRKFEFTPTLPCPFTLVQTLVDDATKLNQTFLANAKSQIVKTDGADSSDDAQTQTQSTGGPRAVSRVVQKDSSGRVGQVDAQDIQNDSEYLAQVSIGTAPQTMSLCFDTGKNNGHTIFDPAMSSSFKKMDGAKWQIQYGDGSTASGIVGTDTVNIGGLNVQNQAVELASTLARSFEETAGDGLLGLAFGSINTVKPNPVHTPVENMITQSNIPSDSELFTAYLTNYQDNDPPSYTFGYIDQDLCKGKPITYTQIDNSLGFWQVKSAMTTVNGNKFPNAGNTAIMDTGTTLSLIDDTTCKNIYAAIPGSKYDDSQGGFIFPSNLGKAKLPTIQFAIGDGLCTIDKDDLSFADVGNGMTYGGIQSRGTMKFSIYGGTVLKSMYAIFDQGRKRFGFVQKDVN